MPNLTRVLVLGANGHVGRRLLQMLAATSGVQATGASRSPAAGGFEGTDWVRLDTRDPGAMAAALRTHDAVVNCVAGDGRSISEGARVLAEAATAVGRPRLVHLSTMSVYGCAEGVVAEDARLDPGLGWYGRAKCEAERHIGGFVERGGTAVVLRPGCVYGPRSELWVGRIGRWLRAGRLGELGTAGDGWSNLVHVDDVCRAVIATLSLPVGAGELAAFNLAAPDSPRWNQYFVDLALALEATPVRSIGHRQLLADAWLASPPLKIAQHALRQVGRVASRLPDPLPPGLLRLWAQHIRLDPQQATRVLELSWTPYGEGLQSSAAWFRSVHGRRAGAVSPAA
jgi:nucleoside-diphosphate-sugar epimerase